MIDLRQRRPPEPEAAKRVHDEAEARIREIVEDQRLPASRDFRPSWSRYKHLFAEAQHGGKCAYCETRIRAGYPGDVEHYRPKAEVKEPRDRGNRDDVGCGARSRRWRAATKPGYWWLAYRWDNYLYSCSRCNSWKANSFPLRSPRGSMVPGTEAEEHPLILNPYATEPSRHLSFNELGEIIGATDEGTVTVDRCGLDRTSLVFERELIARRLLRDLDDYVEALAAESQLAESQTLKRLLDACRASAPYAAMARVIVAARTGLRYEELLTAQRLGLLGHHSVSE